MKKRSKDVLLVGLALFAMFFGAGNLIFPPYMGLVGGNKWNMSMLGFLLTGIGMPLLGIIAVSKAGGSVEDLFTKVGPRFSKVLSTVIILCIGPLLAIPRTGATTYEIGIKPLFNISPLMSSIIFFGITWIFSIKPSKVIDLIGKILTPILLTVLAIIIFNGIVHPIGNIVLPKINNTFSNGFVGGYQTMDALASVAMAAIAIKAIINKGYKDSKEQIQLTAKAALVAAFGLAVVYGGLMYLGATASSLYPKSIEKSKLLILITETILGSYGKIFLGICVAAACLTTSIGLTATVGDFFNELSNGKLKYGFIVTLTCIVSAVLSIGGVEKIVKYSAPILDIVYPVVIVLIIMSLLGRTIKNNKAYLGGVIGAFIISIFYGLSSLGIQLGYINVLLNRLPLYNEGFAWILPAIIGAILFNLMGNKSK